MQNQAVLFDLDGTLLDRTLSLRDFVRWQAEAMLGAEIGDKEAYIARFIELDANGRVWKDVVYETLIDEFSIDNWTMNELLTTYELCFCAFVRPRPGAIEAVTTLRSLGAKIALVSNGKSPFQERNFRSLGISSLFDAVIVSQAVGLRKPDKEIFYLACDRLKVQASNCVFVGDSIESDIEGANNAGMHSIYLPAGPDYDCATATAVCTNFAELPKIATALIG